MNYDDRLKLLGLEWR